MKRLMLTTTNRQYERVAMLSKLDGRSMAEHFRIALDLYFDKLEKMDLWQDFKELSNERRKNDET